MKLSFFDRNLKKYLKKYFGIYFTFATTVITFLNFNFWYKFFLFILSIPVTFAFYCYKWIREKNALSRKITINGNTINLVKADIFDEKYKQSIKIIPCNNFFDTKISRNMITESSINGQYINKMLSNKTYQNIKDINNAIDNELKQNMNINIVENKNVNRPLGGKNTKYKLGSLCYLKNNYCLLAFTNFNDDNNATLSIIDYITALLNMWDNLNKSYEQKPIVLPLLGGGITRFIDSNNGNKVSNQFLLNSLLYTLKLSEKTFNSEITIIVAHNDKELDKINFFEIGEKNYDI